MEWSEFIFKKLSVLITGKDGKKESYMGILEEVSDNFLVLKTLPNLTFPYDKFVIRVDLIESAWIFKE